MSEDTKAMFDVGSKKEDDHKDLGKARMRRDEEDVLQLVSQFTKYEVFRHTNELVVVTTGDVANDNIKEDLLQAGQTGQTIVQEFVENRLIEKKIKFHDSIKQQKLKTFETLYSVPVSLDKGKTISIKADRDLLRRVVVALESGRDVDVDILLQRELSPIPLSLATSDGKLRYASSKADLSNILQNNESQSQVPSNLDKTCTIIDAMAAVQSLANRSGAKTFGEWCDNFLKYIVSKFSARCGIRPIPHG